MTTRRPTAELPAGPSAVQRSFDGGYGEGLDRGVSLGGGGLFFVAWQAAYLHTLASHGIRFEAADRLVGTSAGSVVAAAVAGGKLNRLHSEVSLLAKVPALLSALAPASELHPSQQRAADLFSSAGDSAPSTLRAIGHAALAAVTPNPRIMRRNISVALGRIGWTSEALRITCADAYTGERCVVTRSTCTSIPRAAAASSAVPGLFPPQPIGDRRCMDGGVSGTGTHLDLMAGAKRVLVLALTDGSEMTEGMMTNHPGGSRQELADLEATGTSVLFRVPDRVDMLELMTPAAIPGALAMGGRQAYSDLGTLNTFWG